MDNSLQLKTFSADALARAADEVAAFETLCTRHETPCGAGRMMWRRWGSGPPVVLIHGGSGSWTHWIRNIRPLMSRHTVMTPDTPGMGESAMPDQVSVVGIADTLKRGLNELVTDSEPVDVVGFSFGSSMATVLAARLGERLRNLVLVAARFQPNPNRNRPPMMIWRKAKDVTQQFAMNHRNLEITMFADPGKIDPLAVYLQKTNTERTRFSGRKLVPVHNQTAWEYLPQVRARGRVTAINGSRDEGAIAVLDRQEEHLRKFQPDGWFVKIEGGGHWVHYEAADQFNEVLQGALSEGGN